MKTNALKILAYCAAILLFAGCGVSDPASTGGVDSVIPKEIIENETAGLFKEFTAVNWGSTMEDIKREYSDFYAESGETIYYKAIWEGKNFIKKYEFEENELININFTGADNLTDQEIEQLNTAINNEFESLKSDIKKIDNYPIARTDFGYIFWVFGDNNATIDFYPSDSVYAQGKFSQAIAN